MYINRVEKFDFDSFNLIIQNLANGAISLSNKKIVLVGSPTLLSKTYENATWNYGDFKDPEGWPAALLHFGGKAINNILHHLEDLNGLIKIHQPNSYLSLSELSKELLGFRIFPSDDSGVYVVAPFYKKLENIQLSQNGTLSATFKCHKSLKPSHFRLTIIYDLASGKQDSLQIPFQFLKTIKKNCIYDINEFQINNERNKINVKHAVLFLVHREKKIQTYNVSIEANISVSKSIPIREIENDVLQLPESTNTIVDDLVNTIDSLNNLSESLLGCKIFVNNARTLNDLRQPVTNRNEFIIRIVGIASVINEVYTEEISKQLKTKPEKSGSMNLIVCLLQAKNINYDKAAIQTLQKLNAIRSKMRPIHSGEHEAVPLLRDLGIGGYPYIEWIKAGIICLQRFSESIHKIEKSLADIEATHLFNVKPSKID